MSSFIQSYPNLFDESIVLLFPMITIVFFNFLKKDILEGPLIHFTEFVFYFYSIFYLYYTFNLHEPIQINQDNSTNISTCVFYTFITLFVMKLAMLMNPCRESLSAKENNIITLFILFITYYSIKYFIESNNQYNIIKSQYEQYYKYYNVILLIIYVIFILNQI
jgi:hypothetical protein